MTFVSVFRFGPEVEGTSFISGWVDPEVEVDGMIRTSCSEIFGLQLKSKQRSIKNVQSAHTKF
jgi:hypothetical protein